MDAERKKRLWPWVVAVLIGMPVLYVASFGPVCWLTQASSKSIESGAVRPPRAPHLYWPIGWIGMKSNVGRKAVIRYVEIGLSADSQSLIPVDAGDTYLVVVGRAVPKVRR